MERVIATNIKKARAKGLEAGQEKYRAYFVKGVNATLYKKYKETVDAMLTAEGYADCIVTK